MQSPYVGATHTYIRDRERTKKRELSQTVQIEKKENSADSVASSRTSEMVGKVHSNNFYYSREKN